MVVVLIRVVGNSLSTEVTNVVVVIVYVIGYSFSDRKSTRLNSSHTS